ncbi:MULTISPECIES: NAD-dependent epimerase/dehydratase family protein [unclassified Pseudomonas]|uniref:NAD-dependent epimerase/dehydratase family protein n=1 Tax=unclassified Pseudomonas TaxID=196821 RepID=UPI00235ECBA9|nr:MULTISPECIES: NAD-dependent epimerase/dehydratase family protein [unclassified Pseudomonas]
MERKILVTGAGGFVGAALVRQLQAKGYRVVAAQRQPAVASVAGRVIPVIRELSADTDWSAPLAGVDTVIHLAARVHQLGEQPGEASEARYDEVNRAATLKLARDALAAGVRRFIFVSSIKVNGDWTLPGKPFRADDLPAPTDAYARSKAAAEQQLLALMAETGLEVVIVRPPLIYGPGVKANVARLLDTLARGVPLPLGGVRHNRRSLLALENLLDLLILCIVAPKAAGAILLVSDDEDLSTAELLESLAEGLGRKPRLIAVPSAWLEWGARLLGRGEVAQRLCGSLQVDIQPTKTLLGWQPPLSARTALRALGAQRASAEGRK